MSLHEINRLAALFQLRYDLKAEAAPQVVPPKMVEAAKEYTKTAWRNYVNTLGKDPTMIMHLTNHNHPYAKAVYDGMNKLVDKIDQLTPLKLFNWINRIAKDIEKIANYNNSEIRGLIHDNVRVTSQPELNMRAHIKNKFGHELVPLSSLLIKGANLLARAVGHNERGESLAPLVAKQAKGPPPKEMPKYKILNFMQSNPDAARYGLTSEDIFQKALERDRPLVEKFMRTLLDGKPPVTTGAGVKKLTDDIKSKIAPGPNTEALEKESFEPAESLCLEPPDEADVPEEHVIEGNPHIIEVDRFDPMVDVRQKEKVKQEDEERKKREEEFEMKQNSKFAQCDRELIFLRKVGL